MADEEQDQPQESPEHDGEPGAPTFSSPSGSSKWLLYITLGLAILAIMMIAIGAGTWGNRTGPGAGIQTGGTTGGLCDLVPKTYQEIFLSQARGNIPPALLAAEFSIEHGKVLEYRSGYTPTSQANDPWPEQKGDPNAITKWQTSSAGALGPMQFMPGTWSEYGSGNVQNINDAVRGTANMLQKNYDKQSGSNDERLKKAISRYNPGAGPWDHSWYVDKVWANYQKFNCASGGEVKAGIMDVPYIPQGGVDHPFVESWCGRSSQAMIVAFFNQSNISAFNTYAFQNSNMLSESIVRKYTKKNYRYGNPSLDIVINSLKNGYPAIVYTSIHGQHIFVLTGYDGKTFWANDTFGSANKAKNISSINGIPLTKENLQNHLAPQNGHTFLYVP